MQSLTKVLDGGAVITENCDDSGPEDLQGGDVGREDAKCTRECRYVHLFHTGLFEKHLRGKYSIIISDMQKESPIAANLQVAEFELKLRAADRTIIICFIYRLNAY